MIVIFTILAGSYTILILALPYLFQGIEMFKTSIFKKVLAITIL